MLGETLPLVRSYESAAADDDCDLLLLVVHCQQQPSARHHLVVDGFDDVDEGARTTRQPLFLLLPLTLLVGLVVGLNVMKSWMMMDEELGFESS